MNKKKGIAIISIAIVTVVAIVVLLFAMRNGTNDKQNDNQPLFSNYLPTHPVMYT